MVKTICFLIGQNHTLPFLIKHYDHRTILRVPNIDRGNPDDVRFKSNVLTGQCWYIVEFKSFDKTVVDF